MEPIGTILAVSATRSLAQSAMPNAPVEPEPAPRPSQTEPVRRGTAAVLRRLADIVEPRAEASGQPATG